MRQAEVRIRDGQSAANAYAIMAKLGAPAKLPADVVELTLQLQRMSGRGRELAVALQAFVDAKGFDTLVEAVERNRTNRTPSVQSNAVSPRAAGGWSDVAARADAEAAATPGSLSFAEPHGTALMFAPSGLY